MSVASECSVCFVLFCVFACGFCTGRFVMVPINLTCLHCLQHSFFQRRLNLYKNSMSVNELTGVGIYKGVV